MSYQDTPKICVVIRKRPMNRREQSRSDQDIIEVRSKNDLTVRETKFKVDLTKYIEESHFRFDRAYDQDSDNQQIYLETVRPLVDAAFNKAKVTCFAYGQTGSGKTYTMMGSQEQENRNQVPGLYLLAAQDIFNILTKPSFSRFGIFISFYEIYCGKVYDLLNDRQLLHVREDAKQNVNIVGLQETKVINIQTLMQLINYGMSVRVTNQTGQNDDSSRSHAILQIQIKENETKLHGKISFIDLAGSERAADVTDQNKQTRIDGAEINKSLLALKECIRALDQDKNHTPFRGSKLTLVLRDSFVGNCKTVMIGNISPASSACENTLNTLRYADRVKELKKSNKVHQTQQEQMMLPRQNSSVHRNSNYVQNVVTKAWERFSIPEQPDLYQMNGQNEHYRISQNIPIQMNFNLNNQNSLNQLQPNSSRQSLQIQQQEQPFLSTPKQIKQNPQFEQEYFGQQDPQPQNQIPQKYQNNQLFDQSNNPSYMQSMQLQQPTKPDAFENKSNFFGMPQQPYQMSQPIYPQQQFNQSQLFPNQDQSQLLQSMEIQQMQSNQTSCAKQDYFKSNSKNLQDIQKQHDLLIQQILYQEELLIKTHKSSIDQNVTLTHSDMQILHEVDQPGSDIENYLSKLENVLNQKQSMLDQIKNLVTQFRSMMKVIFQLKQEEQLSYAFYQKRNETMQIEVQEFTN